MSLTSSITMGGNTLRATEIALQVVGQNIANANTDGYIREEVVLSPSPTQRYGNLLMGTGVQVDAIIQKVDKYLEERLRGAVSEDALATTTQDAYSKLESVVGSLSDSDINTAMTSFFNSISDVLNDPSSASTRQLAVLAGQNLTNKIQYVASQAISLRNDINDQIAGTSTDINDLVTKIAKLNVRIAELEGGNVSSSDAVGLRDERNVALDSLASILAIRTVEQPDGTVTVYCQGSYLVSAGQFRPVETKYTSVNGTAMASIHVVGSDEELYPDSGQLRGLIDSRDKVLGGFLSDLDSFSQTLIYEFNKVYSSGQGLVGFNSVKTTYAVNNTTAALNAAGLTYTPSTGSFQILVTNSQTKLTTTTQIPVDLNGIGDQTSLTDIRDAISAIDGLTATIDANGNLSITSDSAAVSFAFANDTSGTLAALGINTFFTGIASTDIAVNTNLTISPSLFAASTGGVGKDTNNAVTLAAFADAKLASQDGASLTTIYKTMVNSVANGSNTAQNAADSASVFLATLQGQVDSISGVSIDEEAINMLLFQRQYQANAKYISTLSDLFDVLVNI